MKRGTRASLSTLCKISFQILFHSRFSEYTNRRTYDDDDQGQTQRSGFEPTSHPTEGETEFAVGESESEDENSDEHRPSSSAAYNELDDRHVWNDGSGE